MDKPVVGDTARNPQNPDLEGLKLCPRTHPYAYRNGTACCGGPGYGNQIPGIEDLCYTHPLKILPNITSSPRNSNRPWFDT